MCGISVGRYVVERRDETITAKGGLWNACSVNVPAISMSAHLENAKILGVLAA
jgi:hypothetical protein